MPSRLLLVSSLLFLATNACCLTAASELLAAKPVVLLVGQEPDGHPPATHEYMPGVKLLAQWLEGTGKVTTVVAQGDDPWPEGPELIRKADGVFLFVSQGARWIAADERRYQALAEHAQQKKGLAGLHWAIGAKDAKYIDGFTVLFGPCHGGPDRKFQFLTTDLRPTEVNHPVINGVEPFRTEGEYYYQLKQPKEKGELIPLLEAYIDDQWHPVSYAWNRPAGGRSFVFSGGHFHKNWEHIQYRRLVTQGILWTVDVEIPAAGLELPVTEQELALPSK